MNAKFSIEQTREQLRGTLGYSFLINSSLDEARAVSGVASSAHGFLIAAIKCYLVGMDHEGDELTSRAAFWLKAAIDAGERPRRYIEHGTEALRFSDLSLALWLLGRESKPVVDRAVEARERYFEHEPLDPVEWSYAVVDYLESERCDLIEKRGRQAKAARGGLIEVDAALAACSDTERERLSAAADSVLKKRSGEWLGKGNFDQFAKWVRVASKTKAGSPRDALRNSMHTVLP